MNAVISLVEQLLVERLLSNEPPLSGKSKAGLSLMALSGFLVILGFGFLVCAAYLWLAAHYPPEIAAATTGAIILFAGLGCAAASYLILQYKKHRLRKLKSEITETLRVVFDITEEELTEPVRENPKASVVAASLAGFAVGEKFL